MDDQTKSLIISRFNTVKILLDEVITDFEDNDNFDFIAADQIVFIVSTNIGSARSSIDE